MSPRPTQSIRSVRRKKSRSETWLVLADIHYPSYDRATFTCALNFLRRNPVSGIVFLGDQFDNAEISHHNSGKPIFKPTGSYARNTANFDRDILQPLEALLPKHAERVWITGNHDAWESQLVEAMPELQGSIERPRLLNLESRGWKAVPLGASFRHGRLNFIHGEALSGQYHAKKAVDIYCDNVVFGHFHSLSTAVKVLPHDAKSKWIATCLPIVGSTNPAYLKNKPTAWLNGFGVVEYFGSRGYFDLFTVVVSGSQCAYGGKVYDGSVGKKAA